MFVPFLIMLREGLEVSLIISLIAIYLHKTQKEELFIAMWKGILISILVCFFSGIMIYDITGEFPQKQQEIFEGIIKIITVIIMTYMILYMKNIYTKIQSNLKIAINKSYKKNNKFKEFPIIIMVFFTITREGLESMFFLLTAFKQNVGIYSRIGAILGLILSILIGFIFYWTSNIFNLFSFFKWGSIFILFVAAGILASAIRSFHDAGIWNYLQSTAFDLSNSFFSSHTIFGTLLQSILGYQESPSIGEVLFYFVYLIVMIFLFFFKNLKCYLLQKK